MGTKLSATTKSARARALEAVKAETAIEKVLANIKADLEAIGTDKALLKEYRDEWKAAYQKSKGATDGATAKAWSKYSSCARRGETSLEGAQKRATNKNPVRGAAKSGKVTPQAVTAANIDGRNELEDDGIIAVDKAICAEIRNGLGGLLNLLAAEPGGAVKDKLTRDVAALLKMAERLK